MMKEFLRSAYFLLRLPVVVIIKLLFFISRPEPERVEKILIIRLDRIGDFVASLPVIDNLKLSYPGAVIHVLIRPHMRGLAGFIKNIDAVLEYDNFLGVVSKLRKERYDLVIDLLYDYKLKTGILAFLSSAPVRLGYAWGFRELLFNRVVKAGDTKNKSMVAVHLEALKTLGVPVRVLVPRIEVEKRRSGGQIVIGIHPGGHYPSQSWGNDNFAALARRMLELYKAKIYIFAGPDEKDIVSYIVSRVGDKNVQAFSPDTQGLVSLIAGCDLLICNNSGPLHVAAAEGVPTVSTMGPTDPVLWWPQGENNIVIRKSLKCSPCGRACCPGHECMNSISVEEMEKAVSSQIRAIKERTA